LLLVIRYSLFKVSFIDQTARLKASGGANYKKWVLYT
jgi:hypothetical protein